MVSERTENSKKYYLGENSYGLDVSIGPIHYKDNYTDKQEQWKDIDLTFENSRITKAPYILSVNQNDKAFTITDKKTSKTASIKLTKIGDIETKDVEEKTAKISAGKIHWDIAVADLDLAITATNSGVSFDWVVKSLEAPHEVEFEIEDGGLPVRYRGLDADKETVEVLTRQVGNRIIEKIEKGGTYPKTINPMIETSVSNGNNDGTIDMYYNNYLPSDGLLGVGYSPLHSWYRFTGFTVPSGVTISANSYVRLTAWTKSGSTIYTRLYFDDQQYPSYPTSIADYNNRMLTSNYTDWQITTWNNNTPYNSPSLQVPLQELVTSYGQLTTVQILHKNNNSPYPTRMWSESYEIWIVPPLLHIEYTASPPEAPTNVSATDGSYTDKVQITWTASSGATSYKVYRNTTNNSGTATQIGTPTQTSYNDTSATPGTTYYYWVKASSANGDSSFSSPDTGWRKLTAPTNVSATDGTHTDKVQITWNASNGATSYKVYRNTTNNSGTATQLGTPSQTWYDDTSATPGTTYYYWVKASCTNGDSGFSSPDTGWRKLTAPSNVQATDGSLDNQVQITWSASSGATSYKVYRNTINDSSTATQIGTPTQTSYDDNPPYSDVTYWYWVKASCANGDSDFSTSNAGYGKAHRYWGTKILDSSTIPGVYGKRSLFKDYNVPSGDAFLYAPTFIGPNKCPLEVISKYYYYGGYKRAIAFYDHNTSSWYEYSGNDVDPYLDGTHYYYADILYNWGGDGKWHARLFNFQTQSWQSKRDASPVEADRYFGWDFFEEYKFSETSWPQLGKIFESDQLQVYDGGWTNCTDTYGDDFYNEMGTAPYAGAYTSPFYHWTFTD